MLLIDLFSLNVLFPQYRSRANTLGNRFFQISSYSRAYLRIISEKTMDQVPLGPILGKQNIQVLSFQNVHLGFLIFCIVVGDLSMFIFIALFNFNKILLGITI